MKSTMKAIKNNLLKVCLFLFIVLQLISCSDNQPTSPESKKDRAARWGEDIDYLSSQLKSNQFNFSSLVSGQTFDSALYNIKSSVDSLQDYEILISLQQVVASFHIAHTLLYPPQGEKFHFLPIYAVKFSDGFYIVMTDNKNTGLLGKKIIKAGNIDISVVEDSLKKMISYENNYWADYQFPKTFSFVEALRFYGFSNSLLQVELEIEGTGKVTLNSIEQYYFNFSSGYKNVLEGKTLPLYLQNYSSYYWNTFLTSSKTFYIAYNNCSNASNISFAAFTENIKNFIASNEVDKVVIDLRNNGGGNSSIINPLLSYLQNSSFNQNGKLFVIIGNHTFSSALLNAISFKQDTKCLLVGEPTGGKPNSYGEVRTFTLPNSGITAQYCIKYFSKVSGNPESLFPDFYVDLTAQDYLNGRDPVLDFILSYQ
jgi:hypothetical protein